MSAVTLSDKPVTQARISFPRVGAWVADLIVTSDDNITGAVSVDMDGLSLSGTVIRSAEYVSDVHMRIVGGKAGLFKDATPKHYKDSVPVRNVLTDLMNDSGESLSSTSDTATLAQDLGNWTTTQQPVSRVILSLLDVLDPLLVFRILADGTLFIGKDSFAQFTDDDAVLVDRDDAVGKLIISTELPALRPGVTFFDQKISYVEHHLDSTKNTAHAWYER